MPHHCGVPLATYAARALWDTTFSTNSAVVVFTYMTFLALLDVGNAGANGHGRAVQMLVSGSVVGYLRVLANPGI